VRDFTRMEEAILVVLYKYDEMHGGIPIQTIKQELDNHRLLTINDEEFARYIDEVFQEKHKIEVAIWN